MTGNVYTLSLDESWMEGVATEVRQSGEFHLARHFRSIAEFVDVDSPACIVTGLSTDNEHSADVLSYLEARMSPVTVVYLTDQPRISSIVDAMRRGAVTVLEWPLERGHLSAALQAGLNASAAKQLRIEETRIAQRRLNELTDSEREVAELIVRGTVNKAIAKRLGIALRTVEARRKRIFTKLGTRSLMALVELLRCSKSVGRE